MALRILVVDDHEPVRRAITSLLAKRPDWHVCGEAADGVEAVARAKELRPDAVLMDVSMPKMDGLQATNALRQQLPGTKVIIISQNDPAVVRRQAAQVRADAYVGKDTMAQELIPSIEKLFVDAATNSSADTLTRRPGEEISAWLPGGGEMGERIRAFDWRKTVLGPVDRWPESLKTAVRICVGSRNPIVLWWGRSELSQFYNDAYISFLGSKKHPVFLGRSGRECWSEIWGTMAPMLEKVFTTGDATWSEDFLYVLNRNLPREEGYFTFSYSPIWGDAGKVEGIFCACYETTARVISDRRLRTLRDLGRTISSAKTAEQACRSAAKILEGNPADIPFALFYLLDEDGHHARLAATSGFIGDSEAAVEGIDPNSPLTAWPFKEVLESGSSKILTDLTQRFGHLPGGPWPESPESALILPIAAAGQPGPAGFLIAGFSPRRIVDADYHSFLELIEGHVATAIANSRAYEEERKRADALAEIDRAKTLFFSNVSHEFRTPLTLMLGPLEDTLASSTGVADEQRRNLEVAHRNSLRLLKLVNTLLDFSRIEAGRIEACFEPANLAQLTSGLASVFRSAIERAGLRLLINCEEIGEQVYIDREMWEKIVFNLISNALKFTFEGEIEVSVRKVGDAVELAVRDTGTGIPADDLPHLFERFYRVKNAHGRSFEGSGIGLALVEELAKHNGGSVRVESKVGLGSTFTVTIPLGKDHLPADRISAQRSLASTALRGETYIEEALHWLSDVPNTQEFLSTDALLPAHVSGTGDKKRSRILLADDNADMRDYVRKLLSSSFDVEVAPDGEAALEAIRSRPPDLILSDVMMPKLDGFGLLKELRSDHRTATIPLIMLSARAGEDARVEGVGAGAADYLTKPFSTRELLARVNSQLNMARTRREAAEVERKLRAEAELERNRLQHEIADIKLLRGVSAQLIYEDVGSIYEKILDAAAAIMGSDYATMQAFYPERGNGGELRMLGYRGLSPQAAKFWEWVRPDSGCTCGEALRTGKRAIAADVKTCEFMAGSADQAAYLAADIHAGQSTPLLSRSGKLLGMISTHWRNPHQPSERDLRLLDILSRQAADLIERVQAQEALRRSAKWLAGQKEAFQAAVNAAPLDVSLGVLVKAAVEQTDGEAKCAFYIADASGTTLQHVTGMPEDYAECVDGFKIGPESLACGLAVHTGQPVITPDVTKEARWKPWLGVAEKFDYRACWSFPVETSGGKVVGTFAMYFKEPRDATSRDRELAALLAQAAGIIISRYQEGEERARAESVLRESEGRFRALVNATSYVVYRMSPDWSEMRQLEGRGFISDTGKPRTDWLEEYIYPDDRELVLRAMREAVRAKSIFQLEHRVRRTDGTLGWAYSRAVPLLDDKGKIIEWFGAASDVTARKDAEDRYRKLAETLDAEVRARTRDLEKRNAEILRQSEQVRELSWRLLRSQDEERRHIARELHDSAGQTLTVLGVNLVQLAQKAGRNAPELATEAETIQEMVQQLHRDIRTTSYLLHPPLLDESGLYSALTWYTQGLVERSGLQINLEISEDFGRLPRDMELVVFRLVQECLTNIHRHSGSKTASIRIARLGSEVTVGIEDKGHGMSPQRLAEIQSGSSGVGIRGMRERLRQFEGEMKIHSEGSGTKILVTIPLPKGAGEEDSPTAESLQAAI